MTGKHTFCLQFVGDYTDAEAVVEAAQQAEALGYDTFFSADHFGSADPFLPLMLAAANTTMLNVGPLVLNNEFHNPAMVARSAATLDSLSRGRLVLGMGAGYMQSEHDATGIELREPPARVDRLAESLCVIRALLHSGSCELNGEHVQVAVESLGIKPAAHRVPILLGGHGRRMVGLAADYADIYQFTGLTHGPGGAPGPGGFALEQVVKRAHWLDADETDRSTPLVRSVLVQATHVGDPARFTDNLVERTALPRDLLEDTPFFLAGSVEQIVDKIGRLHEQLGVTHWVVRDAEGFAPVLDALAG
ncbi:MAG: TIGR03621 family F420-dependent LLM class oxidoreductase [Acidimicrobiales bacterium]|nr:TIGR03621 family F420-dependent LLM class oxidoreductase [Acidimicrobiales bacterium]